MLVGVFSHVSRVLGGIKGAMAKMAPHAIFNVSGLNEESVWEPPLVFRMFPLEFSKHCLQHR